jgi:hypothetical protein
MDGWMDGNVSIFKSTPLPVAGSFTWIWNVAIFTSDLKQQQPISLPE